MNKLSIIDIDFNDYINVMESFLKKINKNNTVKDNIVNDINMLEITSFKYNNFMKQLF